jgi:hypothetical protein
MTLIEMSYKQRGIDKQPRRWDDEKSCQEEGAYCHPLS